MKDYILPGTIIFVVLLTALVLIGIWFFGRYLFRSGWEDYHGRHILHELYHMVDKNDRSLMQRLLFSVTSYISDYLERRNDFWTTYGQVFICIFIVCIIALLLLTKTITAEAGLPILSAISGFAIAKGSNSKKGNDGINTTNNG